MLIGNLEDAEEVKGSGFIIYTDDGVKSNKMTVDQFANALGLHMSNSANAGEGAGGGLQYWKEFKDYRQNSYLYAENPPKEFTNIGQLRLGVSKLERDIWISNFQYDTYESDSLPYFEGCIEFKAHDDEGDYYYPYAVYALLHRNGSVLEDYILVDNEAHLYKIAKSDYDRYSVYFFILGSNETGGTTVLPGSLTGVNDITNTFLLTGDEQTDAVYFKDYKLDGAYSSYDECANALSTAFLLSGKTIEIGGYFKYGHYIDNIANYINRDTHSDDDTYIYINANPGNIDKIQGYSEDDVTYLDKTDIGELLINILGIELRPTYSAFTNVGLFFDIPFYRSEYSTEKKELAIEAAKAMYTEEKIVLKNADFDDVIFLGDGEEYSEFVKHYIADNLENINFVSDVRLGDFSIVSNNIAQLNVGRGLTIQSPAPNYFPELVVDPNSVQSKMTAGDGVMIDSNTNTISATGSIEDVEVDGLSVVSNKVAMIWLPTGLKETRLQNGSHTEIETVTRGTNYDIFRVNVTDVKNNVISNSDNYSFLNVNVIEAAAILSVAIPANSSGIITANLYANSGLNTNDGYISALVSESNGWPANDSVAFTSPLFDSKPINTPYQISGTDHVAITNLKIFGKVTNTSSLAVNYYLLVKKNVDCAIDVQGELTFVQNIDI